MKNNLAGSHTCKPLVNLGVVNIVIGIILLDVKFGLCKSDIHIKAHNYCNFVIKARLYGQLKFTLLTHQEHQFS